MTFEAPKADRRSAVAADSLASQPTRKRRGTPSRWEDTYLQRQVELGEYYRAVFDATPLASIVISKEGLIKSWSNVAEKLFGYSEDEVIDRSVSFLNAPQLLGHGPILEETDWSSDQPRQWQTAKCRSDGTQINVAIVSAPIRDSDGVSLGMLWTVHRVPKAMWRKRVQA